jgi:hypothetical protein
MPNPHLNPSQWYVPLKGKSIDNLSHTPLHLSLHETLKNQTLGKFTTYVCDGQIIGGGGGEKG